MVSLGFQLQLFLEEVVVFCSFPTSDLWKVENCMFSESWSLLDEVGFALAFSDVEQDFDFCLILII